MNQAVGPQSTLSQHFKAHLYPYLVLGALLVFSIPIWRDLVADWIRDDNYSHGFFILPISIWLLYRQRSALVFPAKASPWGMLLFVAGAFGLVIGVAANEFFSTRIALIMMLSGLALYYLGSRNFRKVWFAFFFLLFMVPIPAVIYNAATFPMQLFASKVTIVMLQAMGVPCIGKGNIIQLPEYALEVLEACSGLRSLVTLMALAALYGYLSLPGKVRPVILFLASIPIAIATNIFRIFFTAIAAYAISTAFAEDFMHEMSGILVFVTALALTIILGGLLKWRKKAS